MHNVAIIAKYECKVRIKSLGYWILLTAGLAISIIDNIPTSANIERLPFLMESGYVVSRLLVQTGVLLLFGIMFIVSNSIRGDKKAGVDNLLMAVDLSKSQYMLGKFLGNYLSTLLLMGIYMLINATVQLICLPEVFSIIPYLVGYITLVLPASFFIVGCSISLPMWIDLRLCYVIFTVYFMLNILLVPDSITLPFWFLFYGDLIKLVYKYGFGTLIMENLISNLLFLIGTGLIIFLSLNFNNRFWREKCKIN